MTIKKRIESEERRVLPQLFSGSLIYPVTICLLAALRHIYFGFFQLPIVWLWFQPGNFKRYIDFLCKLRPGLYGYTGYTSNGQVIIHQDF